MSTTRTDRTCGNRVSDRDLDPTQDSAETFFALSSTATTAQTAGMGAAAGMGDLRGAGRIRAARDTHHTQDPSDGWA